MGYERIKLRQTLERLGGTTFCIGEGKKMVKRGFMVLIVLLASFMITPWVWAQTGEGTSTGYVYGDKVYMVDQSGMLSEIDPATHATLRQLQLPAGGREITVSNDGTMIYVTLSDARIVKVDRASFTIISQ